VREHTSAIRGAADMETASACVSGHVWPTAYCWCSSASR
jgi:hypothetical protein